jgi:hypothetical protein
MNKGGYPFIWNSQIPIASIAPSNSFATIQTPFGTFPVADSPIDFLTLTSSDSSIVITGDAFTDTVDITANLDIFGNVDGGAANSIYGGTSPIDGGTA